MHYDFEDNRNKKPYTPPTWYQWQPDNPLRYLMVIVFFILGLPYLFGYILTPLGTLFNLLFIDWWLYIKEQAGKVDSDHYKQNLKVSI